MKKTKRPRPRPPRPMLHTLPDREANQYAGSVTWSRKFNPAIGSTTYCYVVFEPETRAPRFRWVEFAPGTTRLLAAHKVKEMRNYLRTKIAGRILH